MVGNSWGQVFRKPVNDLCAPARPLLPIENVASDAPVEHHHLAVRSDAGTELRSTNASFQFFEERSVIGRQSRNCGRHGSRIIARSTSCATPLYPIVPVLPAFCRSGWLSNGVCVLSAQSPSLPGDRLSRSASGSMPMSFGKVKQETPHDGQDVFVWT